MLCYACVFRQFGRNTQPGNICSVRATPRSMNFVDYGKRIEIRAFRKFPVAFILSISYRLFFTSFDLGIFYSYYIFIYHQLRERYRNQREYFIFLTSQSERKNSQQTRNPTTNCTRILYVTSILSYTPKFLSVFLHVSR